MNTYALILSAVAISFGIACASTSASPGINAEPLTLCGAGQLDKMSVSPNDYLTPRPNNNGLGFVNQAGPSVLYQHLSL